MKPGLRVSALALALVMLAIQLVPVTRTNPEVGLPLSAPAAVTGLLRRACYDCHSNDTRWPWYSRVAPVSWIIVRHVTRAREELNFSEWGDYYPNTRRHKLQWIGRVLRERTMPPRAYRLMHPAARLTQAERAALQDWIESALAVSSVPASK
jgi:Haem-binding domain